jgi:hypothetical protein
VEMARVDERELPCVLCLDSEAWAAQLPFAQNYLAIALSIDFLKRKIKTVR